ncbi:MAG: hypothetical protein H7831_13645 [Magnetococcus sp. WYHC-3]
MRSRFPAARFPAARFPAENRRRMGFMARCMTLGATLWMAGLAWPGAASADALRGTGDLGLVVERASGSVLVVEHTRGTQLCRITGLGDLSHASAVFSRDERHAYLFGRDGGLSQINLLTCALERRVVQAGNSIGGAISQDGTLVAVANYEPGGVRVFRSADLSPVADIPGRTGRDDALSKVVGLEDSAGQSFVYSLYEAGAIMEVDFSAGADRPPRVIHHGQAGRQPYDALITPDGRQYIAGLFGEDRLSLLDLWHPERGITPVLPGYGRGDTPLPVYKMPHLEGWGVARGQAFLPAVGRHEVLALDLASGREAGRMAVAGQPVFIVTRPDGRQAWVNFALPHNHLVQVIDLESRSVQATLTVGAGVLHLEFTPRGERVWVSVRDEDRVDIFDTASLKKVGSLPAAKPSGIFFSSRAHRTGL